MPGKRVDQSPCLPWEDPDGLLGSWLHLSQAPGYCSHLGRGSAGARSMFSCSAFQNKQILILNRQKQKRDSQAGQAGKPGLPSRVCIVPCGNILRLFTALHDNSSIQFQQKEAEAEKHVWSTALLPRWPQGPAELSQPGARGQELGHKILGHLLLLHLSHQEGARIKVEQPWLKPASIQGASLTKIELHNVSSKFYYQLLHFFGRLSFLPPSFV